MQIGIAFVSLTMLSAAVLSGCSTPGPAATTAPGAQTKQTTDSASAPASAQEVEPAAEPAGRVITASPADIEDFRLICDVATSISAQAISADELRTAYATEVNAGLTTESAKRTFEAASMAADDQKHSVIAHGASEIGITDWSCPALTNLYGPQTP